MLVPENLAPTLGAGHLRTVLLHELAHIKRGDLWINLAQTILQIIYFYNPLLWLVNSIIRRIREQAVDEAVQVAMGANAPQYPQTLVDVAKMAFNHPALSLRLIGVVESKSALKERIKKMLDRPIPKTAKLGILGLITVLIFAAVLLPMAEAQEQQQTKTDYSFVTVKEGVGFDNIVVGDANCTGQFIKSKLGKPDEENKDEKQGWWLNYREKYGLDFWLNLKKQPNLKQNTLCEIRLNKGFKGKLSSGISMSSTRQDVFKTYGQPIREEVVEDLTKRFDDRVLLIRKGGFAKIHYDDKGLLFWFDGDNLTQMRVGVVSVPDSNEGRGDDKFRATLSNGVTVELVGICEHPSEGKQWWRPDGTAPEKAPYLSRDGKPIVNSNEDFNRLIEIAVGLSGADLQDVSLSCKVPGATRTSANDVEIEGLKSIACEVSKLFNSGQVNVGVAAGSWETIGVQKANIKEIVEEKVNGGFITWDVPLEKDGKASIKVAHSFGEYDVRVIARDRNGNILKSPWSSGGGADALRTTEYRFPVHLAQIDEFQFLIRPYQWVEFKNVSLRPGVKTDVQVDVKGA
ncbi:MAG: M56 family metallopeptidase, partial [Sedimentisphaerales bacterium]|nr:M56 family metallopeptidase [Sedimentisphaerales bacterium]